MEIEEDEAYAKRLQEDINDEMPIIPVPFIGVTDEELARKIQEEEEMETFVDVANNGRVEISVDDMTDPVPNIHDLFAHFNEKFFENKLGAVTVAWSPRMTLCAGTCSYNGRGSACVIKLSEPLLKYRSRQDLVDTLLHEMIHAFLFLRSNIRDHDDHGEQFQYEMKRINAEAGAHISVFHHFKYKLGKKEKKVRSRGTLETKEPLMKEL